MTGTVLLCLLALSLTALAEPPAPKHLQWNRSALTGDAAYRRMTLPQQLDLRPPDDYAAYGAANEAGRFSGLPTVSFTRGTNDPDYAGAGPPHARIMGSVEAFAHRVRHEGLPVARLWENHAALVSLGLNPKGKPGLWLVQKTH